MHLSSADETDLLLPLHAGVLDQGEWSLFLRRVRKRTGADYASLIFAQGDTPMHLAKEVYSGRNLRAEARAKGLEALYEKDRLPYYQLRPGRVYHAAEFSGVDVEFRAFLKEFNRTLGLSDERIVRIREAAGTSAWLMLARESGTFSAADGALMTSLAPHIGVALRNFVLTERQRVTAAAASDGLMRAGLGWIAIGRDARIVDFDRRLLPLLRTINGSENLIGERLHVRQPAARQAISQTASRFAADPGSAAMALFISEDPPVDALLVPMAERPQAALDIPVMTVFCRVRRESDPSRKTLLAQQFGLGLREAELALALCEERSIVEAAEMMNISEKTARGYSKIIYGKMGVRGQAELVRMIFLSSAYLA